MCQWCYSHKTVISGENGEPIELRGTLFSERGSEIVFFMAEKNMTMSSSENDAQPMDVLQKMMIKQDILEVPYFQNPDVKSMVDFFLKTFFFGHLSRPHGGGLAMDPCHGMSSNIS